MKIPNILIVDDVPANLRMLFEHLQSEGYRVLVAEDGESALQRIAHTRPDLILLDVKMPGIDGFETCRRLKEDPLTTNIPILFMTVVMEPVDKVRGLELGAVDYITKPIEVPEVVARVNTHLRIQDLQHSILEEKEHLQKEIRDRVLAEAALERAQRRDGLATLAGGVAHKFNNLLVSILGHASLAQLKLDQEHPAYDCLESTVEAAELATDLARQMLAYSGRGRFRSSPQHIGDLISKQLPLLKAALPSQKIVLRADTSDDAPTVRFDSGQIEQVLTNLVLNSAEAIGDRRGTIRISVRAHEISDDPPEYWRRDQPLAPGTYALLEVDDDGGGLSANVAERMFDPFFSTKPRNSGLGLAAAWGIIDGHGGGVEAESNAGEGTTIRVILPPAGEAASPPEASGPPADMQRVLIIDDEAVVRETVSKILTNAGYRVLTAHDGREGADIFKREHAAIDLVILDYSMPGMSGVETLQQLRTVQSDLRVIMSSGYDIAGQDEGWARDPGVEFLQKPYSATTLLEVLARRDDAERD